jgi:hypothetical protein
MAAHPFKGGWVGKQAALFRFPKMRDVWRTVWCPPNELRRRSEQQFADFSPNKGVPANRKKGFYKIRLLNNEEVRGIIV